MYIIKQIIIPFNTIDAFMKSFHKRKIEFNYIFTVVLLFCFCQSRLSFAEDLIIGTPPIFHYNHNDYNGDSQFWTACQDHNGIMYFGNNDGAIVYNGEFWKKVFLPNKSSVRSLICASDGTIYAGGYNEFGIIERDEKGDYYYKSLTKSLLPEDSNFGNIWQIHEVKNQIVFRGSNHLIIKKDHRISIVKITTTKSYSELHNNLLFLNDKKGVQALDISNLTFQQCFYKKDIGNDDFLTMIPVKNNNYIIITNQGNVFTWNRNSKSPVFLQKLLPKESNNLICSAILTSTNDLYIGTLSEQISKWTFIKGKFEYNSTFQNIQDNTVLDLFEAQEGNIWVMLNKGIDCINPFSPMTTLFTKASTFDATIFNNQLFIATNQGVYKSEKKNHSQYYKDKDFKKIPEMADHAWSLMKIDSFLVCGHNKGLFIIDNKNNIQLINEIGGVWKVYPITKNPNRYFICTYNGLYILKQNSNGFKLMNKVVGFDESTRDIQATNQPGVYWVCHGYKGVYRITIKYDLTRVVSVEHFTDKNGLPSVYNINVHKWDNDLVFTTNHGIFNFDSINSVFKPNTYLNNIFGTDKNIRQLIQKNKKVWVIIDDELGFFDSSMKNPKITTDPFLSLKNTFNRSMECIIPINDSNTIIGTTLGMFSYQSLNNKPQNTPFVQFTSVDYQLNDSIVNLPTYSSTPLTIIPASFNEVKFQYSTPLFHDKKNVEYSYILEGYNNSWSDWSNESIRIFSYLKSGTYTFIVKSRSMSGEVASPVSYQFIVNPVWYRTTIAIIGCIIIIITLLWLIIKQLKKVISNEKEKTRLEEKKLHRVLELELQQLKLEKERQSILEDKDKLEEDVIHKSKELVNYTMLLAKKRELIIEMQYELKDLRNKARNELVRSKLQDLSRRIELNLKDEQYLQLFESNFERVHQNFFNELKCKFPDISQRELRLSAFIKMDLSNKEIASILNISVRGVETARYRLKKKLNIDADEQLSSFLEKISTADVN